MVKPAEETAVPAGPMTVMGPVLALGGTTAPRVLLFVIVKAALVPAKRTAVAPRKFTPETITLVPGKPWVGLNPLMTGAT